MVSVDYGGKLFERISGDKSANSNKHYYWQKSRHSTVTASFCPRHGNHRVREFSASRGWVLLLLFLPIKKSKNDSRLPMIAGVAKNEKYLFGLSGNQQ
jgi:hypothetical protein